MATRKKLAFCLMDPPYENARTTTAFRLLDLAARRGYDISVFAYEGAVAVPFIKQQAHANAVHGRDLAEEDHPLPHQWVEAIRALAEQNGGSLDWVNCGLCVDERGVAEALPGVRRGSPADLLKMAQAADNTLVIPTK
jgi:tRNA 2-thiouridine synthesizing protein D